MRRYLPYAAAVVVTSVATITAVSAKKPEAAWQVSRVTDPVTGRTSCVVAAFDRGAGIRFTRTGYLYPLVENHPMRLK